MVKVKIRRTSPFMANQPPIHGRGAAENPRNRFEPIEYLRDPDLIDHEDQSPETHFLKDTSRSLISTSESPDVVFDASINVYRGCEHGCIYCYARPTHEYLGFSRECWGGMLGNKLCAAA